VETDVADVAISLFATPFSPKAMIQLHCSRGILNPDNVPFSEKPLEGPLTEISFDSSDAPDCS
jgi:hypothetical protein